jgi:hypothetical protein
VILLALETNLIDLGSLSHVIDLDGFYPPSGIKTSILVTFCGWMIKNPIPQ